MPWNQSGGVIVAGHDPLIDIATLGVQRARLVRLCYRLTGNLDAAEDLAQETLFEALHSAYKLHDPYGYAAWLSAIARNVCLRWREQHGREAARRATPSLADDAGLLDFPDEDYDLDVELERRELIELLDRALALLPEESRQVLIERYVRESPQAEMARRLGLTGPAVAKRLERGRLRLKRILSTELIHSAVAFGLADKLFDDWDETIIWCFDCGTRHLLGRRMPSGRIWLICKPCVIPVNNFATVQAFNGVRGYEAAYRRSFVEHERTFGAGLAGLTRPCWRCGAAVPFRVFLDCSDHRHYASPWCDRCKEGIWSFKTPWHLMATPEGQRFYRDHPRLRSLPDHEVEAAGVPALVVGCESITGSARLDGIFVRNTFERIHVHVRPGT